MSKLSTKWRPINALNKDLSGMIYPGSESIAARFSGRIKGKAK